MFIATGALLYVCDLRLWGQGVCMSCYALALTPLLSFILQDVEQADNGHTESGVSGLNSCMNVLVCTSEHTLSLVSGISDNCTRGPDPCNSLINSKKKIIIDLFREKGLTHVLSRFQFIIIITFGILEV